MIHERQRLTCHNSQVEKKHWQEKRAKPGKFKGNDKYLEKSETIKMIGKVMGLKN